MPPTEDDLAWLKSTFHPIPKSRLPDDCVEYSLHIISSTVDLSNDSEVRQRLRDIQKHASELCKKWLKDYIWQQQGFALELTREDGSSLLRGRTEYGDSVEDEWVVVWLLRELTRKFPELWIKVADNDGEFLLIEAAGTLPAWLEPDVAENRVWIHNGSLTIVKPQTDVKSQKKLSAGKLSLKDAQEVIVMESKRLLHSISIEEEAFYRLRNYPQQIAENMHHTLVTLPRTIAFLLHQKPAYISPAIEAFYLRDPIALKPLQTKGNGNLTFQPCDFTTVSVKLPRVGYAQLRSQDFPTPATWAGTVPRNSNAKADLQAETGMKISCGFEMLLSDPQHQDKPNVREMKIILEDLKTGDEVLPANDEISKWSMQEDDEKWLDISYEDLENELSGAKGRKGGVKRGDFGDKAAQENLQRIVAQFEQFLNDDTAGPDGAGFFDEGSEDDSDDDDDDDDEHPGSEGEDKEASFDEDEFTRMMREMMGMPSNVMQEIIGQQAGRRATSTTQSSKVQSNLVPDSAKNGSGRVEELSDSDTESQASDADEIDSLTQRMEAELRQSGALNLSPTSGHLNRSLGQATLTDQGKGKAKAKHADSNDDDEEEGDEETEDEDDIDVNLVRNLLESLKSQAGAAGPGGNLLGMMGMSMPPRDGGGGGGGGGGK